ncbi:MAG: oligoendopeptidase F, partial [Candidatus Hydrogenedens sp.]
MSTSKIKKLPPRSDVPVEFTWNLSPVFPDDKAWEKAYQNLEKEIPKFSQFRKKLAHSPKILYSCLELESNAGQILERLSVYANLKACEDISNTTYLALAGKVQYLSMLLAQAVSFIAP